MQQIRCYACNQKGHLCCSDFFDNSLEQVSCYNCAQSGHSGLVSFNAYRPSNSYCCHMLLLMAGNLHWNFCYRDVLSNAGKLVLSQPQPYASNVARKVTSHAAARRMPRLLLWAPHKLPYSKSSYLYLRSCSFFPPAVRWAKRLVVTTQSEEGKMEKRWQVTITHPEEGKMEERFQC
jgi:hypothetical protein